MTSSALSIFVPPCFTFGPLSRFTYSGKKTAFIGWMAASGSLSWSSSVRSRTPGVDGRFVTVVLEDVPAAEHDVVEARQGDEVGDLRRPPFGALSEANGRHLGERADRLSHARRMASTPAIKVVVTAPIPGSKPPACLPPARSERYYSRTT